MDIIQSYVLCYQVFAFGLNYYCQAGVAGLEEVPEPREIYSGEGKLKKDDIYIYILKLQYRPAMYAVCNVYKILMNYHGVHVEGAE